MNWEEKNWGLVAHLFGNHTSCSMLKGLIPGQACSVHYHDWRWNKFVVVTAVIDVVLYGNDIHALAETLPAYEITRYRLRPGMYFDVPPLCKHSFEVVETGDVVEVYWTENGEMPTQDDINRIIAGRAL